MAHVFEVEASDGTNVFAAVVVTTDEAVAVRMAKGWLAGDRRFDGSDFRVSVLGVASREASRGVRVASVTPLDVAGIDPAVST